MEETLRSPHDGFQAMNTAVQICPHWIQSGAVPHQGAGRAVPAVCPWCEIEKLRAEYAAYRADGEPELRTANAEIERLQAVAVEFHNIDDVIEIRRLKQELSLAEEGLANYAQEVERLKAANESLSRALNNLQAARLKRGAPPQSGCQAPSATEPEKG